MDLPGFLRRRAAMHPEHIEHYARHRTIRMGARDVGNSTVVVRCGKVRRLRLIVAFALMKIAARVGGFRGAKLVRDK